MEKDNQKSNNNGRGKINSGKEKRRRHVRFKKKNGFTIGSKQNWGQEWGGTIRKIFKNKCKNAKRNRHHRTRSRKGRADGGEGLAGRVVKGFPCNRVARTREKNEGSHNKGRERGYKVGKQ